MYEQDAPCITEIATRRVRARKQHVCAMCGKPIDLNVEHIVHVYKDYDAEPGGKFCQARYHSPLGYCIDFI